jgi:alpha-L-fucosidase
MDQAAIRKLQPAMLMNERQHMAGDVITYPYEVKLPKSRPSGLWEHCFPLQPCWGYAENAPIAPLSSLTARIARCRSWGGNVLANFGPRPDGEMPSEYYVFMKNMAEWMSWAAPAVTDVQPSVEPERCNLPTTVRGSTWYAFLPPPDGNAPAAPRTVTITCDEAPKSVRKMHSGLELAVAFSDRTARFSVEPDPRMTATEIIEIRWR